MKIGDKYICKKTYNPDISIRFFKGKEYIIEQICDVKFPGGNYMETIIKFNEECEITWFVLGLKISNSPSFSDYFYEKNELRLIKLNSL